MIKFNDLHSDLLNIIFKNTTCYERIIIKFVNNKCYKLIKDFINKDVDDERRSYFEKDFHNLTLFNKRSIIEWCMYDAITKDYNSIVTWISVIFNPNKKTVLWPMQIAAQLNKIHILNILREYGFYCDDAIPELAAGSGRLEVLKWIYKSKYYINIEKCMFAAISNNDTTIIKMLLDIDKISIWRIGWIYAARFAASQNKLESLKCLWETGGCLDESICESACRVDNIEMLKWARTKGCEWKKGTCLWYARGNAEMTRYIEDN